MTEPTLNKKQQYWLNHVQAADASDGSIAAYAAENDLSSKMLYAWKARLINQKRYSTSGTYLFTPIRPSTERLASVVSVSDSPSCRVTLPTGTRIEFMGKLAPATVRSILTFSGSR